MATKSKPATFYISVPVSAKQMDKIAELSLIELEDYAPETLKAAGLKVKELKAQLLADEAFRTSISKQATKELSDYLDTAIDDFKVMHETNPIVKKAVKAAEKVADTVDAEQEKRQEQYEIRQAMQFLRNKGFEIVQGG